MRTEGIHFPGPEKLLPQRPPMLMIDRMISMEQNRAVTEFSIRDENIFCDKGLFREAGVLENIAQSAAALNGYLALQGGGKVNLGYIGGIKNMEFRDLPHVGDLLNPTVEETHRVMDALVLTGTCMSGARIIATCELKVFIL